MTIDRTAHVFDWTDEELERTEREYVLAVAFLERQGAQAPIESLRQLERIREEMRRRGLRKQA